MEFRSFLGGSPGAAPLSEAELQLPFRVSPTAEHPFLTLGDYFGAVEEFVAAEGGAVLWVPLAEEGLPLAAFSEAHIYSEKHGAFYHIVRLVLHGPLVRREFAVTVALADTAGNTLATEYRLLQQLGSANPGCFPAVYGFETVTRETPDGSGEFVMLLGEWLTRFHEWHLSSATPERVRLWDSDNGHRYLSAAESFALLRQAAAILSRCYDGESFCQVYPWHHGAGDFVFRSGPGEEVAVKLVTVRHYAPLVYFQEPGEGDDRLVAAIHFLLNLAVRMRLDRRDGVGEPLWFRPWAVAAAVAGFFDGLAANREAGRPEFGPPEEFLAVMRSFDVEELRSMHDSLLEIYRDEDEDDFRLIEEKLDDHAAELHRTLADFSL